MKEWIYVCEPEPEEMLDGGILPKDNSNTYFIHFIGLNMSDGLACCHEWCLLLLVTGVAVEGECFSSSPSATWCVSLVLMSLHFVLV